MSTYTVQMMHHLLVVEADSEIEAILVAVKVAGYAGVDDAAQALGMDAMELLTEMTAELKE